MEDPSERIEGPDRIFINPAVAARYPVEDQRIGDIEYRRVGAAATAAPVEQSEHDSCSHWREGDSDNCVRCGDDLGPTDETDVNEGAR